MNMRGSQSLEDRLIAVRRRPSGFDYMRISLALMVFLAHTIQVVGGDTVATVVWKGPAQPILVAILPMFFALSGFLVSGSLERCRTLVSFLGLRVMRIIPALAFETLISALILGPIFTSLSLGGYLSSAGFYAYLLNIVGDVHMKLPGVFLDNIYPDTVNAQLWVLPRELKCYILLGLMFFVGLVKPTRQTLVFVILLHIATAIYFSFGVAHSGTDGLTVRGWVLILSFIAGVTLYIYRKYVPWNFPLFMVSALACTFMLSFNGGDSFSPIPIAYATVYLGLCNPARNWVINSGDYSYGIYLYGFPLQQAVAALGPWTAHWYVNIALALPATILLAVLSWYLVEKPILRLRPHLTRLEDRAIVVRDSLHGAWTGWVRRSLSNE